MQPVELNELEQALAANKNRLTEVRTKLVLVQEELPKIEACLSDSNEFQVLAFKKLKDLVNLDHVPLKEYAKLKIQYENLKDAVEEFLYERNRMVSMVGLLSREIDDLQLGQRVLQNQVAQWNEVLPFPTILTKSKI